ncbi:hypothetical protein [Sphingomonas mollis]|uniref:Uncharacterized protein n=1 Tax=Sphingomonas mollis TaxID=2795726 RepID=A0ABS0XL47_9SPHN|nr:hypothetical protein [Sphingomonas sp. BT553]MBJ6120777.1 hypothetical protein [Sphingomonas sp. BT553]
MGMLGTAKPLASLSSGLLARKGQARPAMRPQGFSEMPPVAPPLDDLGWNDMGTAPVAPVRSIAPAPTASPAVLPPVLVTREALRAKVEVTPVSLATAQEISRESATMTEKGKAAFTLRLDGERHLRLRLASAVANRSAQGLVADALDMFLETMPMVEALAVQLPLPKPAPGKTS